jgi:hypothetical protein
LFAETHDWPSAADVLALIDSPFRFRFIVEKGLSHAVLTQTQGCQPVIINPKMFLPLKPHLSSRILSNWAPNPAPWFYEVMNSFVVKKNVAYLFLTQGKKTVIDRIDLEKALTHRWIAMRHGPQWYAVTTKNGKVFTYLHRFLTEYKMTECKDGDGLNNRRNNLLDSTHSLRSQRARLLSRNNTSGYRGVSYRQDRDKFAPAIRVNYKTLHLGLYSTAEEAARAYDTAALKHFGPFARLNFH